ncbi:MAG: PGF-pre-PGF domain-containing protein [Nanoarchaeota archaeon]
MDNKRCKRLFSMLFIVGILAIFAWMVLASTIDFDVSNTQLISPIGRQNISASFLLNITAAGRGTPTEGNFSYVNASFINGSLSWVYNVTVNDSDLNVNQTFNVTINTATPTVGQGLRDAAGALPEGVYNISMYAKNTSDGVTLTNLSAFKGDASQFIVIDRTAPTVILGDTPSDLSGGLVFAANGSFIGSNKAFLFNVTITNDTELTAVHYVNLSNYTTAGFARSNRVLDKDVVDDGGRFNFTWNQTELTEGENYLAVGVNDTAGNLNNSFYIRVYVDTVTAAVNISTPGHITWTTDTTPDFVFNFVDLTSPNASCSVIVNDTARGVLATNVSARNNTVTTLTPSSALSLGVYTWGVNCTDLGGNHNRSRVNYTLDIVERPTLTAPANTTFIGATGSTNNTIDGTAFTFNFTSGLINTTRDQGNISCELFIQNASGGYNASGVNTTVLNATATTIRNNQTITDGTKGWFINCTYNSTIITSDTWTIYVDTTAPTVNLEKGQNHNNWTWATDTTPTLYYNFTDNTSPNASCELFMNGVSRGVNSSVRNNTQTEFTNSTALDYGTYTWYVNCTDLGSNLATSGTGNANLFYLDVVRPINVSTPLNNSWTSETRADNISFTFNFVSGFVNTTSENNVTCELFITNHSGVYLKSGVNSTALNNTPMTIRNNNTILDSTASPNGVAINWTVNCTYNGTIIQIETGRYQLNIDNVTTSVTASSSSVAETTATLTATTSETATCRYSSSNVGYSSMTEFGTTGSTSHSTSLVSLSSATGYTYYVKCQDNAANEGSGSTIFTTTASSGGSGTGGAGGGVSSGATGEFTQETWASINAGETATVGVTNGEIGVTEVSFTVDATTYGAWLKVEKEDALPSSVGSYSGTSYKTIKITESNIEKALKDTATINFKVAKTWLSEKGVTKESIALFRYDNNAWEELPTTVGEDDGTYVHYSAKTAGFSYFVIGVKGGVAAPAAEATPTEEAAAGEVAGEAGVAAGAEAAAGEVSTVSTTGAKKTSKLVWLVPLVALIILVAGVLYYFKRKK